MLSKEIVYIAKVIYLRLSYKKDLINYLQVSMIPILQAAEHFVIGFVQEKAEEFVRHHQTRFALFQIILLHHYFLTSVV